VKVETAYLKTIKNYATNNNVTPSYIYKLVKEKKLDALVIDGVQFIDTNKFPIIPAKR
jgi:hypothetical protein